jgi:hypothetical protein
MAGNAEKIKARCPKCRARMKAKSRYCGQCRWKNPLFAGPAAPAAAAKAAGFLAPVVDYQAVRAAQLWKEAGRDSNPDSRECLRAMAVDIMKGGGAA